MKKSFRTIVALICTAFALTLVGCDKENETSTNANNNNQISNYEIEEEIVGHWNEKEILYIYTQGSFVDTSSMFEEGETSEITFNADKTYSSIFHSLEGDASDNGTWSVSGNILTTISSEMGAEFDAMDYKVNVVDGQHLTLINEESGEDEDGPYSINIVIRLERIN